jgi:phosphatidylethanolamine-binding protein (PEBP) family uncharacterized protein
MKKLALIVVVFGLLGIGSVYAQEFTLKSNDLSGQLTETQVFFGFGCNGKNISPSLKWINAPKNTKSFAFTVYDPDAPTGSGWWHWVIFNISSDINELRQMRGIHKKVWLPKAVAKLDLDEKAPPAMVGFFLNQHVIAKASLIAYYGR